MHLHFKICTFYLTLIILTACTPTQSASPVNTLDAKHFHSFWIWGDIKSQPYLHKAKELYILQGEIRIHKKTQQSSLIPQGVGLLNIPHQKVWLVFRSYHLNWQDHELEQILKRIQQWENKGNQIIGIQIDFDGKTQNMKEYALFLQALRLKLPTQYKLSITGLLDWTNIRDPETLALLKKNIDEIAIQTYQGTTTIENYQIYLKKISKLDLPYKIGVVQNGQWEQNFNLSNDPNFKGYIMFLLRQS